VSAPEVWTVVVTDPQGGEIRQVLSAELVDLAMVGERLKLHAKAAYLASVGIQMAAERGELAALLREP